MECRQFDIYFVSVTLFFAIWIRRLHSINFYTQINFTALPKWSSNIKHTHISSVIWNVMISSMNFWWHLPAIDQTLNEFKVQIYRLSWIRSLELFFFLNSIKSKLLRKRSLFNIIRYALPHMKCYFLIDKIWHLKVHGYFIIIYCAKLWIPTQIRQKNEKINFLWVCESKRVIVNIPIDNRQSQNYNKIATRIAIFKNGQTLSVHLSLRLLLIRRIVPFSFYYLKHSTRKKKRIS